MASHETENIFKQQQILLKPINKIGVASTWKETEDRQLEVSETEAPLGGFLDQSMSVNTLPPQTAPSTNHGDRTGQHNQSQPL